MSKFVETFLNHNIFEFIDNKLCGAQSLEQCADDQVAPLLSVLKLNRLTK